MIDPGTEVCGAIKGIGVTSADLKGDVFGALDSRVGIIAVIIVQDIAVGLFALCEAVGCIPGIVSVGIGIPDSGRVDEGVEVITIDVEGIAILIKVTVVVPPED